MDNIIPILKEINEGIKSLNSSLGGIKEELIYQIDISRGIDEINSSLANIENGIDTINSNLEEIDKDLPGQ